MLYVVRIHQKKKTLAATESSFWYSTWTFFVVISIFPSLAQGISNLLSFARIFDLGIVVSLMVLTIMTFFNYFKHNLLDQKIEKLIRSTALRPSTQKKKYAKSK